MGRRRRHGQAAGQQRGWCAAPRTPPLQPAAALPHATRAKAPHHWGPFTHPPVLPHHKIGVGQPHVGDHNGHRHAGVAPRDGQEAAARLEHEEAAAGRGRRQVLCQHQRPLLRPHRQDAVGHLRAGGRAGWGGSAEAGGRHPLVLHATGPASAAPTSPRLVPRWYVRPSASTGKLASVMLDLRGRSTALPPAAATPFAYGCRSCGCTCCCGAADAATAVPRRRLRAGAGRGSGDETGWLAGRRGRRSSGARGRRPSKSGGPVAWRLAGAFAHATLGAYLRASQRPAAATGARRAVGVAAVGGAVPRGVVRPETMLACAMAVTGRCCEPPTAPHMPRTATPMSRPCGSPGS